MCVVAPNSGGGEGDLGYLQGESAEEGGAERKKEDINCFNSTITSKRSPINNQVRGSLPRVLVYGTKDLRRGNESHFHR